MKFKGFAVKLAAAGLIIAALVVCCILFYTDIIGAFFYVLRLLAPFIIAFLLSLAADPLAEKLHKRFKLPRNLTAILVIILMVGIIGGALAGLIWKLVSEMKSIYTQIPEIYQSASQMLDNISSSMSELYKVLPSDIAMAFDSIGERLQTGLSNLIRDNYKPVVMGAGNFAKSLPSVFIGIIVFILSLYFMISSPKPIKDVVKGFMPKKMANGIAILSDQIRKYLGGYVKAQLIIMSVAFILIFAGLTILKIPYSMLIALGIAFFDALPFFGSGAILIPWSVIAFITSDIRRGIGMLIIYLSVIFTRQMIEPKIVSSNIGVNPILTLMSMYIGYKVFSIGGMILGPIILMFAISLYKAGAFNGIIRMAKKIGTYISKEIKELISSITLK